MVMVLGLPDLFEAQSAEPTARFSFNFGSAEDEITHRRPRLAGVKHTVDRFGNADCALFFSGSKYSYVNLGTYDALKPREGSISLWVKVEHKIWSGTGVFYNPVLITKNTEADDFYEAVAIYYMLESERLTGVNALDSTRDVGVFSNRKFERYLWHHVVMCYNFEKSWLYIDGRLDAEASKLFSTTFLASDSVVLGNTANRKNGRYLNGCIDDVAFYNRVLNEEEVRELYNAPDPNARRVFFRRLALTVALVVLLLGLAFGLRYYIRRSIRVGKAKLELANRLLENELRINRAMMNPHFVFNAMNTLHGYIIKKDYEASSNYLVKFSRLMRKLLDSNMVDTITLETEIEILERYLEIETLRFKEHIFTRISVEAPLFPQAVTIPIMLLQPFVENAVWHGLRLKEGRRELALSFALHEQVYVKCVIEDNGVGREKSHNTQPGKKSLGTAFVQQRLELLNRIHGTQARLEITDKPGGQGTVVTIYLPILNALQK